MPPVEVEVRIEAAPETVFDFFTEPDLMIQWIGRSAQLDPRPGGGFRCDINGRAIAAGEYLELQRPRRIVFSWGWEGEEATVRPGSSRVEVLLDPDGEGTNLRLVHHDLPDGEASEKHGEGWRHYLPRLRLTAAGETAGPDEWADA